MGGSGGGSYIPDRWTPEQVKRRIDEAEKKALESGFNVSLSDLFKELLREYNDRNPELIQQRLNALKEFISDELETSIDSLFGGSVAKHTYVDGLSDVDTLFILKDKFDELPKPSKLISDFTSLVQTRLGTDAEVTKGDLAVTVEYPDNTELQILPGFRSTRGKLYIPSTDGKNWSKIDPEAFQEELSSLNAACDRKLIPTIKLAKAIIATLPEGQRLSGYHTESLAVRAFKQYAGQKTLHAMLVKFFESAKTSVKTPISDKTGQSDYVDEYLGDKDSKARLRASHMLGRIEKRMRNANAAHSIEQWESLFELEETRFQ